MSNDPHPLTLEAAVAQWARRPQRFDRGRDIVDQIRTVPADERPAVAAILRNLLAGEFGRHRDSQQILDALLDIVQRHPAANTERTADIWDDAFRGLAQGWAEQ
jgi:hypothetical protein